MPDSLDSSRSFIDALADADRAALQAAGHRRWWPAGEALIRAGDRADSSLVLLEGLVKIHRFAADGADVMLSLSGPGDLLGEVSAVAQGRRSASATALTPVEAIVLAGPELRGFLAAHPQSAIALLELTLDRLHVSDARRMEFATSESLGRVTSRLIELAARFGTRRPDGAIDVALPMTQEDLASWSASSRESTARALRTLRELGLIETHRLRLTVLDLERLRGHAARL